MADYDIYFNNFQNIRKWLEQQPNYVSSFATGNKIVCSFNHTPEESRQFKMKLANIMLQIDIGDNTFENLIEKIEAIQTDQFVYSFEGQVNPTMSTSFTDLFSDYNGRPFLMDTTGFKQFAITLFWDKGATPGTQRIRIIDDADDSFELINVVIPNTAPTPNEVTGQDLPAHFLNFKGRLRIQVNSTNAGDSPTFDGLYFYLRRGN